MKKNYTKKLLMAVTMLLCSVAASAYDFEVDGIYYNTFIYPDSTVSVAKYPNSNEPYSGSFVIPESVTYNDKTYSVTDIDNGAFKGCKDLTSITIPNSIHRIGMNAFYGCSGLTNITIPNKVSTIESSAFSGCSGLTSVIIPNSVTSIGEGAFANCSGLTNVTIGNSVISIGERVFERTPWYDNQPNGVVYAGKVLYKYKGEMPNDTSIIIEDGTLVIADCAFEGCSGLASVTIPNSVTSIGYKAFSGCSGLTNITIPNSVTSIVEGAFYQCTGLTSITIPKSVTIIAYTAFFACTGLTSIVVESGNSVYDSRDNCNALIETATNTLIQGCKNTIIPNSVTKIGNSAFIGCSGLTNITIPNSVTSIGYKAFYGCSGLTNITIPNSVTSIGNEAFYGCTGLKTVINFSNLDFTKGSSGNGYIAYYADKVINAPNGTIEGDFFFSEIENVNTLCGYIGNSTIISLPNNYKGGNYTIGARAFYNYASLTSITIPNSVTSIGNEAFYGCTGLTSITIPKSVTSIGKSAFNGRSSIVSVYSFNETPAEIQSSTFYSKCYTDATLYVPQGSLEAYKAATGWKKFANIVEFDPTNIEGVTEDGAPAFEVTAGGIQFIDAEGKAVAVYTTAGALVEKIDIYAGEEITLEKGVYIIRVGDKVAKVIL